MHDEFKVIESHSVSKVSLNWALNKVSLKGLSLATIHFQARDSFSLSHLHRILILNCTRADQNFLQRADEHPLQKHSHDTFWVSSGSRVP